MKNTLQLEDVFDELNHPFRRLNFISFYEKKMGFLVTFWTVTFYKCVYCTFIVLSL